MMKRREFVAGAVAMAIAGVSRLAFGGEGFVMPEDGYSLDDYKDDLLRLGLRATWEKICAKVMADGEDTLGILKVANFGELYERGLALLDKNAKKTNGQYFTPPDVSRVMCGWFDRLRGGRICDVGCGVGNLTLAYFDFIGRERALEILNEGRLHLYDIDETALMICVKSIAIRFGADVEAKINVHCGDFLDADLHLSDDCKVITNPPYSIVSEIPDTWEMTAVVRETKELYAAFSEKIMRQSRASVAITPYSFIGGMKFYPLRKVMNEHSGFVVSFDNVPGTIFCGRKHGIFNSNMGNAVRAAITVVEDDGKPKGFRFGPLIRFKAVERERLLDCGRLESFVGEKPQLVSEREPMFAKCDRRLDAIFEAWKSVSEKPLCLYLSAVGKHEMFIPNTCRYFTTASAAKLPRSGQINLSFSDKDVFNYVFCMVNSSFAYWHWRLYDGGITYSKGLLERMPLFFSRLDADDKKFFKAVADEMIECACEFVITKNNVGAQENIKYPREFRDKINARMLKILGVKIDAAIFDIVHSNMALEVA